MKKLAAAILAAVMLFNINAPAFAQSRPQAKPDLTGVVLSKDGIEGNLPASEAYKNPIPLKVEFATESGVLKSLEGDVPYNPGDAIMTGVKGEMWPVKIEQFNNTYKFSHEGDLDGAKYYVSQSKPVLAVEVNEPFSVLCYQESMLEGKAGDILIQYGPNNYGIVDRDIFAQTYTVEEGLSKMQKIRLTEEDVTWYKTAPGEARFNMAVDMAKQGDSRFLIRLAEQHNRLGGLGGNSPDVQYSSRAIDKLIEIRDVPALKDILDPGHYVSGDLKMSDITLRWGATSEQVVRAAEKLNRMGLLSDAEYLNYQKMLIKSELKALPKTASPFERIAQLREFYDNNTELMQAILRDRTSPRTFGLKGWERAVLKTQVWIDKFDKTAAEKVGEGKVETGDAAKTSDMKGEISDSKIDKIGKAGGWIVVGGLAIFIIYEVWLKPSKYNGVSVDPADRARMLSEVAKAAKENPVAPASVAVCGLVTPEEGERLANEVQGGMEAAGGVADILGYASEHPEYVEKIKKNIAAAKLLQPDKKTIEAAQNAIIQQQMDETFGLNKYKINFEPVK